MGGSAGGADTWGYVYKEKVMLGLFAVLFMAALVTGALYGAYAFAGVWGIVFLVVAVSILGAFNA